MSPTKEKTCLLEQNAGILHIHMLNTNHNDFESTWILFAKQFIDATTDLTELMLRFIVKPYREISTLVWSASENWGHTTVVLQYHIGAS